MKRGMLAAAGFMTALLLIGMPVRAAAKTEYPDGGAVLNAAITKGSGLDELAILYSDRELTRAQSLRLTKTIESVEKDYGAVGFLVTDLKSGVTLSYNTDLEVYSASAVKAPYIFSLIDAGHEPDSTMYSAGHYSDNDSYRALRRGYGPAVFVDWVKDQGLDVRDTRWNYCYYNAGQQARMWLEGYRILTGDDETAQALREIFEDSHNSALEDALPKELEIYSKAGWITSSRRDYNVYNVAGVVLRGEGEKEGYLFSFVSDMNWEKGYRAAVKLIPMLDALITELGK